MYAHTWLSLVLLYITHACATVPNGTAEQELNARQEPIFYEGFCGIDLRGNMDAVHSECDKSDARVVLRNDPITNQPQYVRISGQANQPAPPNTECDHYMELQIVNSVAMAPTDDAPLPNNGACSAINAMLDTMKGDFPFPGKTQSEYKSSFIRNSPLFERTNQRPNTFWVNSEINRLKGKMIRRFLTTNQAFARGDLTDREVDVVLPALKAYIRNRGERSFVEGLADDLDGAWQDLINDVDNTMATLIGQRWGPGGSSRNDAVYRQKIQQLANGKNKFDNEENLLLERFNEAMEFLDKHPFAV